MTALALSLGPIRIADGGYPLASWAEAYKQSPKNRNLPWSVYKRHVKPTLAAALERGDTDLVTAYVGDVVVGWLAWCAGKRVDIVHWVHTRHLMPPAGLCTADGCIAATDEHTGRCPEAAANREKLRRRGVMTALLARAALQARVAYTFKGPLPRHRAVGERRRTSDEWLTRWLAGRGIAAAYVPYEEWSR